MNKTTIAWIIRIIIFALFVLSAVAKMFPIWAFEKQLVDLGIASWCFAPYLSRAIIGFELAIGLLILQNNYLKRIVIPVTIALLAAFCIHLSIEMVKNGAMNGNCGCFGQLIPMTPLEAFVKNIITILLLVFLYRKSTDKPAGKNKFSVLLVVWLASTLLLFTAFPFCPCDKNEGAAQNAVVADDFTDSTEAEQWIEEVKADTVLSDTAAPTLTANPDTLKKDSIVKPVVDAGPPKVKSRFTEKNVFSGKKVNLNQGKRIICFFAPGCDHCQHAAKDLNRLGRENTGFPPVVIYFMDEEADKIPEFFNVAGKTFPYTVLDIPTFWTLMGPDGSTPGVYYLWNGNIQKYWVGIDEKKFTPEALMTELKK